MSQAHSRTTSIASSSRSIPILNVIQNTPPADAHGHKPPDTISQVQYLTNGDYYDRKSEELLGSEGQKRLSAEHGSDRHVHYPPDTNASIHDHTSYREDAPSRASASFRPHSEPVPKTQHQILTALAIGAPLIASVVSSCTSVISADLTSALDPDPTSRPAKASVIVTLLWCALITSLGSTMTAVSGLAMHAGYHDSHVGVTKRIVRFLREWREERKAAKRKSSMLAAPDNHHHNHNHTMTISETQATKPTTGGAVYLDVRIPSPALSAVTDDHREQHMIASFRAAVVSARLLGLSVALLGAGIAVYLFTLYPVSVAVTTLVVGLGTAAVAAAPLLPIVMPRRHGR
ncbi:hypothetical protein K435DRAFT_773286 [Dendrothele bispora CBS 962.96]|uniref:Transmembrane protein n=1 Tax=Dendrothele bispora (strain CBS 962.96) TaxID=1314807 RepID=A0A4S8MT25_DENBC|nr:hypothetical protein K435DRAFT_773286 [Dendrothele bispora CBS 962.96]